MLTKKPLIIITIYFILGILISRNIYSNIYGICIVSIIICATFFIFKKEARNVKIVIFIACIFHIFGYFNHAYNQKSIYEKYNEYINKDVFIEGYIDSSPEFKENSVNYIVSTKYIIDSRNKRLLEGNVLLTFSKKDHKYTIPYGSKINVKLNLQEIRPRSNPMGFDYKEYLAIYSVSARAFLKASDIKIGVENEGNFLIKLGLNIREKMTGTISSYIPKIQAGLLSGILLGIRDALPEYIEESFRTSGLTHIMAVSGANVAFILLPLLFVLNMLKVKKRISYVIGIVVLGIFILITGFEASVLRAVVMADIILLGKIFRRDSEIMSTISLSALIILLYNPFILFSIGFVLSYGATLSLLLLFEKINSVIDYRYIPKIIKDTLAATLAAQIGVTPIIVYYFNNISLISVFTNLIVVPITGFITVAGFIMLILSQFNTFVTNFLTILIANILNNCLMYILIITKYASKISFASINVNTPSIIQLILIYVLLIFIFFIAPKVSFKRSLKYAIPIFGAIIIVNIIIYTFFNNMKVFFLDVGEGDAIFIDTQSRKKILVDGGGYLNLIERKKTKGEYVVKPFLYDYGVSKIDLIVSTHADADHLAGLFDVIKDFEVEKILIPDIVEGEAYERFRRVAKEKNIEIISCRDGDKITLDEKTIMEVINPAKEINFDEDYENNASLVFKLCYNKVSFLFAGDLANEGENIMIHGGTDLSSDVLKVGHHGSNSSTSEMFLNKVAPKVAIVSVGKNNYGHPSNLVLKRLNDKNIKLFRTDNDGAIVVESDGKKLWTKKTIR